MPAAVESGARNGCSAGMRFLAPLLLLVLAACPRGAPRERATVDCAAVGRPELGAIEPLDCDALAERAFAPLAVSQQAHARRTANYDPLIAAAGPAIEGIRADALSLCADRNGCAVDEATFRVGWQEREGRAGTLRFLAEQAAKGDRAARRDLAGALGVAAMAPGLGATTPAACPADLPQPCDDGTCAPQAAFCCGDGTSCPSGACCGDGCCGEGEICGASGTCEPAPQCGGAWPVACPDGTCAPAGASCCGEGRFCRSGTCCGAAGCCTEYEACVAGRCVPGGQTACSDPRRPIPCADGACAPIGGSCCGEGRVCESGTCCGDGACCLSGEICVEGRCMGPAAANPSCGGGWPVTCADGTCAPAGAACCGAGRYCQAGSSCCGSTCCLPGEICDAGQCVGR